MQCIAYTKINVRFSNVVISDPSVGGERNNLQFIFFALVIRAMWNHLFPFRTES